MSVAWLDDRVWCHPKFSDLSDGARWLWVKSLAYASGFGTQGRLSPGQQQTIGSSKRLRAELVAARLWDEVEDGAVEVHHWRLHNAKRDAKRAADRERKQKQRDKERDIQRDIKRDTPRDRRGLTDDRVTRVEPNGSTREPNPIWDALTEVFGEAQTETARTLRGKVCRSLKSAGATSEDVLARARSWPRHFEGATLTETALEKHWAALGRPPLRLERR